MQPFKYFNNGLARGHHAQCCSTASGAVYTPVKPYCEWHVLCAGFHILSTSGIQIHASQPGSMLHILSKTRAALSLRWNGQAHDTPTANMVDTMRHPLTQDLPFRFRMTVELPSQCRQRGILSPATRMRYIRDASQLQIPGGFPARVSRSVVCNSKYDGGFDITTPDVGRADICLHSCFQKN